MGDTLVTVAKGGAYPMFRNAGRPGLAGLTSR